ncbi:MAG: extracellular solute-binding protein [Anaerovoracaceae bacterium]|jgi:multiple sugar transport system substrate-binding protein
MGIRNKRWYLSVSILMVVTLFAVSLMGCEKNGSGLDPQNPVTVTLWHYYTGDVQSAFEEKIGLFNQTVGIEKGIIVDSVGLGSIMELEENITASAKGVINSNPMPDIFFSYPDKVLELDEFGVLTDLNQYFSQKEKEEFVEDFLSDAYFSEGRMLLVPIVKSTENLYVNNTAWSDFCSKQGLTNYDLRTWESLYQAARLYYQETDKETAGVKWDGKSMMGIDSVANYLVVASRQMGIDIVGGSDENEGRVELHRGSLQRIFDIYYNGYSMKYFNSVCRFRSDDVKSGDLIAYTGSSSGAAYFPTWVEDGSDKKDIDFLALAYPVFKGGEKYAIQQGAGICITNIDEKRVKGSVEFLKWLNESDNNLSFALSTGYLPVKKEAYSGDIFNEVIEKLRSSEKSEKIVGDVYEIVLKQVVNGKTCSTKTFDGSYRARRLLEETLMEVAEEGRKKADELKDLYSTEDKVIGGLETDLAFVKWLERIEKALNDEEIPFKYVD